MTGHDSRGTTGLFLGLLRAQGLAAAVLALLAMIPGGIGSAAFVLWGGGISLLANVWAGFQLWLHPGNDRPARRTTLAIRAEFGRVAIVLLLFWLTLSHWPETRTRTGALSLFTGFFLTQLAGWIWLARAGGTADSGRDDRTDN